MTAESTAKSAESSAKPGARGWNLRLRFTRLGLHFLFVAVFAMAGGAIRGFNLLLVLAGVLIAVLLVQWRCSRRAIESLTVDRQLPDEAFSDRPFRVRYQVRNRSRWLTVWMIRIDDELKLITSDDGSTNRKLFGGQPSALACGVGRVGPNESAPAHYDCVAHRRGRYQLGDLRISTSFPFSLLCATGRKLAPCYISVYPKLLTLHRGWQRHLLALSGGGSATARRSGLGNGEFYGLRQWHRGDSPRQIHWRTTARIGDLAVRQTEDSRRIEACLLIDGWMPSVKKAHSEVVEAALSLAATIAVQVADDPENIVSLITAGTKVSVTGRVARGHCVDEMLQLLARFEGHERNELVKAIEAAWEISGGRQSLVVLSTRSLSAAMQASPGLDVSLASWRRQTAVNWIDLTDPAANTWYSATPTVSSETLGVPL